MLGEIKILEYLQCMGVKFPGKNLKNKYFFFNIHDIVT
jgi:hypothetical protein